MDPYHQPQQQQQQQTVVIVNQPQGTFGPYGIPQCNKPWTTGLCGCFEDCCSCVYAYFCFPCFMCTLAGEMGEFTCGPFCCGSAFIAPMRTKVRTLYGIEGSICKDLCAIFWCQFCAVTQMHRELKNHGQSHF